MQAARRFRHWLRTRCARSAAKPLWSEIGANAYKLYQWASRPPHRPGQIRISTPAFEVPAENVLEDAMDLSRTTLLEVQGVPAPEV